MELKVAFYPCDSWAVGYYRSRLPAQALNQIGHKTEVFEDMHKNVISSGGKFDKLYEEVGEYDIHVFQRIGGSTTEVGKMYVDFIEYLKTKNKMIVADLDDNLLNVPLHNPAYQVTLQNRPELIRLISLANLVTVTNEFLKELYKRYNKNTQIFRNYVDLDLYLNIQKEVTEKPNPIVFGWAGSQTHKEDLELLRGVFQSIGSSDWELEMVGENPEIFESIFFGTDYLMKYPVEIDKYPALLAEFDIGIAPLVDNKFTRGKSYLKALEYNAVGIPVLASDMSTYQEYVRHGVNGYLVGYSGKDWLAAVKKILRMTEKEYVALAQSSRDMAARNDINKNIHKLEIYYANTRN